MTDLRRAIIVCWAATQITPVEACVEPFGSQEKARLRTRVGKEEEHEGLYRLKPTSPDDDGHVTVTIQLIEGRKISEATERRRTRSVVPEEVATACRMLWQEYRVLAE